MERKKLGNTGVLIPEVGIGTWKMVGNEKNDIEALRYGMSKGMNLIDTAEMYGNEDMVGDAIHGQERPFIATKVSPNNFRYDDVIKACDRSLSKLRVKQIDLYQLHWPNHSIHIKETMQAMEQLVKDGKIKYIGVSNFNLKELKEAQSVMKSSDIVSNQVEYSILVRDVEKDMLDYCTKNKITLIAYSPLARGALFEKKYGKLLELLDNIGKKHSKTASQVALNWLIDKEPVIAIPKASSKRHIDQNAGASGWKLDTKELSAIEDFLLEWAEGP
jgi:diketogulonate reductase-like aldo/keto reductase